MKVCKFNYLCFFVTKGVRGERGKDGRPGEAVSKCPKTKLYLAFIHQNSLKDIKWLWLWSCHKSNGSLVSKETVVLRRCESETKLGCIRGVDKGWLPPWNGGNSCYYSWARRQNFFCLQLHANEGKGSLPISLFCVSRPLVTVITAIQPLSTRLIKPNFCNKWRLQNYLSMLKPRLSETSRIK